MGTSAHPGLRGLRRLDAIERADLLVTYTSNVRSGPAQQDALVHFVERGGRWLALHGTNSAH